MKNLDKWYQVLIHRNLIQEKFQKHQYKQTKMTYLNFGTVFLLLQD
jgi:hypothetical protein